MICIRRKVGGLYVDDEWESWERLTFKGLRRKSVAASLGLTVLAQAKAGPVPPMEPSADAITPPSRVHGLEMREDQNGKRHSRETHVRSSHDIQPETADVTPSTEPIGPEAHRNDTASDKNGKRSRG